jgi:O-antigen ligase
MAPGRQELASKTLFVLFLLSAFVGIVPLPLTNNPRLASVGNAGSGDVLRQVLYVVLFFLIAVFAARAKGWRVLADVPGLLVILLAWCGFSVAWSAVPDIAARRLALTTVIILMAIYSVRSIGPSVAFDLLFKTIGAIIVADWLTIPLFANAVHPAGELDPALIGAWRGLHPEKNTAGAFCAVATLLFITAAFARYRLRWAIALAALAIGFLINTKSKTSLGLLPLSLLGGYLVSAMHRRPGLKLATASLILFAVSTIALFNNGWFDQLDNYLDDPTGFTGRTQIWDLVLRYAADHFMLGAGYGSFWGVGTASPATDYGAGWALDVAHAHNGYLDLLAQLGVIGAGLGVCTLIIHPLLILLRTKLRMPRLRPALTSVVVFCALHNLLETSLLSGDNGPWVALLLSIVLARELRKGMTSYAHFKPPSRLPSMTSHRAPVIAISRRLAP